MAPFQSCQSHQLNKTLRNFLSGLSGFFSKMPQTTSKNMEMFTFLNIGKNACVSIIFKARNALQAKYQTS